MPAAASQQRPLVATPNARSTACSSPLDPCDLDLSVKWTTSRTSPYTFPYADPAQEYFMEGEAMLIELQRRLRARENYMRQQPEFNPEMRGILIDWFVEVCNEYRLEDQTLHLAVNYLDRFLSRMRVTRGVCQLVGVAALMIASKLEEVDPPHVEDFVFICDSIYTTNQLRDMELRVLACLQFDLAAPTTNDFVCRFVQHLKVDDRRFAPLVHVRIIG